MADDPATPPAAATPATPPPAEPTPATPPPAAATPAATDATAATAAASALPPVPVPVPVPDTGYTPAGVPTLEGVREKIETRLGTALGATELAEETREGRTAAQQFDARQKAAEDKLEEIRASMHKPD